MEATEKLDFLSTLIPLAGIIFIIALGVLFLTQQFRKNIYRQKLAREQLIKIHREELLKSSILVQEEERKRIASDLHDELGAVLSIARMQLLALEDKNKKTSGEYVGALEDVRYLIETSVSSTRRISHQLMPQNLEMFGLLNALKGIVQMANNANGINIEIVCDDELDQLTWELNLGLYRICLELINNTIKHAKAKRITISVQCRNNQLILTYEDDGVGLPKNFERTGLGHKTIEARTLSMNGILEIQNSERGGFYAQIIIPDVKA
jgi:signal transduction histidine kinase